MKLLFVCLSVFCGKFCLAQHPVIARDTITYNGKKYCVGDTVHLGYGSKGNKDFAFIHTGSALMGLQDLEGNKAKADVVIDKVYKQMGKIYARGKEIEGHIIGYNIFIEIEGAVDNKEIIAN